MSDFGKNSQKGLYAYHFEVEHIQGNCSKVQDKISKISKNPKYIF